MYRPLRSYIYSNNKAVTYASVQLASNEDKDNKKYLQKTLLVFTTKFKNFQKESRHVGLQVNDTEVLRSIYNKQNRNNTGALYKERSA